MQVCLCVNFHEQTGFYFVSGLSVHDCPKRGLKTRKDHKMMVSLLSEFFCDLQILSLYVESSTKVDLKLWTKSAYPLVFFSPWHVCRCFVISIVVYLSTYVRFYITTWITWTFYITTWFTGMAKALLSLTRNYIIPLFLHVMSISLTFVNLWFVKIVFKVLFIS